MLQCKSPQNCALAPNTRPDPPYVANVQICTSPDSDLLHPNLRAGSSCTWKMHTVNILPDKGIPKCLQSDALVAGKRAAFFMMRDLLRRCVRQHILIAELSRRNLKYNRCPILADTQSYGAIYMCIVKFDFNQDCLYP